jgi:mRNA interferase RelE/StbE
MERSGGAIEVSDYKLYITPACFKEIKSLPGHIRQRVRKEIGALANDPRPSQTKALNVPDIAVELRRLRLDKWRVLYAITEADKTVDVLAVRKRPPYDYGDLEELIEEIDK